MSDDNLFALLVLAAVCGGNAYNAVDVARAVMENLKKELKNGS